MLPPRQIWAPVSITIPGHRHGAQTCPFSVFLAPKAKGRGRTGFLNPLPLLKLFITISQRKKRHFWLFLGDPMCITGACAPQGVLLPPGQRGKRGLAGGGAELTYFLGAALLFLCFSALICRAE